MRILFVYGVELTLGGHFKSGQALAKGLSERGHRIVTWVRSRRSNPYLGEMRASRSEVVCYPLAPGRNWPAKVVVSGLMMIHLALTVLHHRIEIIHCQDTVLLRYLVWIAKLLGRKLVCTQAGGEYVDALHPASVPLVVYSQELQEAYAGNERCDPERIHYIAERIDSTVYHRLDLSDEIRTGLGISPRGRLAFTAIRIDEPKRPWLDSLFDVAGKVDERGQVWTFAVAGEGDLFTEMGNRAAEVNSTLRHVSLVLVGPVSDGHRLAHWLNAADVVIGNGRSLMEGISCQTLGIILGEHGEAELLDDQSIAEVMRYNFSGRHFRHRGSRTRSLADAFALLEASWAQRTSGDIDIHAISPRLLDHRVGAEKLENVYQNLGSLDLSLVECLRWEKMRREAYRRRLSTNDE